MSVVGRREFLKGALLSAGSASAVAAERGANGSEPMPPVPQAATSSVSRPFVFDMHVHMSDPEGAKQGKAYRDILFKNFQAIYDGEGNRNPNPKKYTYLPEEIIERMNEGGVDVSLVMVSSGSRRRGRRRNLLAYMAQQLEKYPGRLVGVPTYDPLHEPWRGPEFVDEIADLGFKGVKLLAAYEGYDPYDEKIWPFYEKAVERGILVDFHTGWGPVAGAPLEYGSLAEIHGLDKLGRRYPELKVNVAHAGGPAQWPEAVLVTAKHENFSLDFSSWCAYPPQQLIAMLALARDVDCMDKVMFGSEHSICDPGTVVGQVRNINLWADRLYYSRFTEEDIAKILGLNAARRFNLSTSLRF